jgi:hypothetical protein
VIVEVDLVKSVLLLGVDQQDQKPIPKTASRTLDQNLDQNLVHQEVQKPETALAVVRAKAKA